MDLGINLEVLGEENEEELLEFVKFIYNHKIYIEGGL